MKKAPKEARMSGMSPEDVYELTGVADPGYPRTGPRLPSSCGGWTERPGSTGATSGWSR
jgi:hypothetical protein